jgi:hypothetical protein
MLRGLKAWYVRDEVSIEDLERDTERILRGLKPDSIPDPRIVRP